SPLGSEAVAVSVMGVPSPVLKALVESARAGGRLAGNGPIFTRTSMDGGYVFGKPRGVIWTGELGSLKVRPMMIALSFFPSGVPGVVSINWLLEPLAVPQRRPIPFINQGLAA